MPIYEFKCRGCGEVFEELVSQISNTPQPCPACASKDTEKLMSACGTIMSGGKDVSCPAASSCAAAGGGCCGSGGCGMMGG